MSEFTREFSEDVVPDWTELLPRSPLFECLREEGTDLVENGNLMCEIRGDLFVWSSAKSAVLTTNLKRLKAHPDEEQIFQTLVCTAAPLTPVHRLLPDEAGGHMALVSRQAVSVMTLPRSRGEHGEFGGGQLSVNCRVTPIATDLFAIHHHTLHLLQAHWHPSLPHTLLLLTSDSTLRVYSMADPNYPRHSIPLSPSAANQVHGCILEDSIVSIACTRDNKLFALRDTGDVVVTTLAPPPRSVPSDPLPMHPMSEDNYGTDEATAVLVLETTPPILIIAHLSGSGTIYHCVYIAGDEEQGDTEEGVSQNAPSQHLYVVECVKLELQEDDHPLTLTKDPVLPYRYYISHVEGMHMVTIPWANRMNQFITTTMQELVMKADSDIYPLVAVEDPTTCSVQGAAIISEPLLEPCVVVLNSDLECQVLFLCSPPPAQFMMTVGAMPTRPHPQVRSDMGGFVKVIRDILAEYPSDPLPLHAAQDKKNLSQQDCFVFLQRSVQNLRIRYLLPQQKAKATIQRRLDVLARQKEQQLRDLVALRDEREEVAERNEDTRLRMKEAQQKSFQLLQRMERLLCKLESQSPVLSDAEVAMEQELSQLSVKLETTYYHIEEAKSKLSLGYGEVKGWERVNMSRLQDDNICSVLEDAGKRLLPLKLQVQAVWLGHDIGHHSVFQSANLNRAFHHVVLGLMKGVSSYWWNYRHFQHHAKPNVYLKDPDITIPYVVLYGKIIPEKWGKKRWGVLPYHLQHLYLFLMGPPLLVPLDHHIEVLYRVITKRKWIDFLAMLVFYMMFHTTFSALLGGFWPSFRFYFFIRFLESHWFVWASQVSHAPMNVDLDRRMDWASMQLAGTRDVEQSFLNDWFLGHVNFQIEHHLFPTMPRHNYVKCKPYVIEFCKKHNLDYQEKPLWTAFGDVIRSLKESGEIWAKAWDAHVPNKTD